jgi:hypothetical protein
MGEAEVVSSVSAESFQRTGNQTNGSPFPGEKSFADYSDLPREIQSKA